MINFKFRPESYFSGENNSVLLVKMNFPESKWGEQLSIYAHGIDHRIQLEAVDFYGNEYLLYPSSVDEPLLLEDMIYLLEGIQLNRDSVEGGMELILDGHPQVESSFYPELSLYFDEKRKSFGLD
jgi:hypothetical protein